MGAEAYILAACIGCAAVCVVAMAITVVCYFLIQNQIRKAIKNYKEDCEK